MGKNNQPRIMGYDPNTGAPIYSYSQPGSARTIKGIIIGLIITAFVIALGAGGWLIYDKFFNYTEIDLFSGDPGISVHGMSGNGSLMGHITEYSGPRAGEAGYNDAFYNSIQYKANATERLSNGDEVVITALYDKNAAKRAKIKVSEESKSYEVSGLWEYYKDDASDIDQANFAAMKQYMKDCVLRDLEDYDDVRYEGMIKLFYIGRFEAEENAVDLMIGINKMASNYWNGEEVFYEAYVMGPILKGIDYSKDTESLEEEDMIICELNSSDESLAELEKLIKEKFSGYKITELKV